MAEAHVPGAHAPQQEKPLQWEAGTLQLEVASPRHNGKWPVCSKDSV